jgi:hypothetical protein
MMLRKSNFPDEASLWAISTPSCLGQALVKILVGDHADADEEIRADRGAHRIDDAPGEAQAVVERAAIDHRRGGLVAGDQKPSIRWP